MHAAAIDMYQQTCRKLYIAGLLYISALRLKPGAKVLTGFLLKKTMKSSSQDI
jgi:hypothetical protein